MIPVLMMSMVLGCKRAPPDAPPAFNDALVGTFVSIEDEDTSVLADQMRALEDLIRREMDLDASSAKDRALTPDHLSIEDIEGLDQPPNTSLDNALPIAVAGKSRFGVDKHKQLQLLVDHRPIEPYSPDHYKREFLEGEDCWTERKCEFLRTFNDLTKKNFLMEVPYEFYKDFRWVDLNQAPPDDKQRIAEEERWAYVARSWNPKSYKGVSGKATIKQSYTVEVWIPREHGGLIHMLSLWSETKFNGVSFSDDQVAGTTREGIDKNFDAAEDYLADR